MQSCRLMVQSYRRCGGRQVVLAFLNTSLKSRYAQMDLIDTMVHLGYHHEQACSWFAAVLWKLVVMEDSTASCCWSTLPTLSRRACGETECDGSISAQKHHTRPKYRLRASFNLSFNRISSKQISGCTVQIKSQFQDLKRLRFSLWNQAGEAGPARESSHTEKSSQRAAMAP